MEFKYYNNNYSRILKFVELRRKEYEVKFGTESGYSMCAILDSDRSVRHRKITVTPQERKLDLGQACVLIAAVVDGTHVNLLFL